MILIYKNFLPKKTFKEIQEFMLGPRMPWYYNDAVALRKDKQFMFFHLFYHSYEINTTPELFEGIIQPILRKLKITKDKLIRAKANWYTNQNKHIKHEYHIDQHKKHKVCLLSVNTNNGYTEFKNGDIVDSIENQAVVFDGDIPHRSVTQKDKNMRVNINLNYDIL
jgi:hypothetical protein